MLEKTSCDSLIIQTLIISSDCISFVYLNYKFDILFLVLAFCLEVMGVQLLLDSLFKTSPFILLSSSITQPPVHAYNLLGKWYYVKSFVSVCSIQTNVVVVQWFRREIFQISFKGFVKCFPQLSDWRGGLLLNLNAECPDVCGVTTLGWSFAAGCQTHLSQVRDTAQLIF